MENAAARRLVPLGSAVLHRKHTNMEGRLRGSQTPSTQNPATPRRVASFCRTDALPKGDHAPFSAFIAQCHAGD